MNTLVSPQQIASVATGNISAFQSLADIVMNASGQLMALNFDAARNLCVNVSAATPVVQGDLRDQVASGMGAQAKSIEQTVEYFNSINDLLVRTQGELADFGMRQLNDASHSIAETLEQFAGAAPAGTSDMISAVKSAVSNATATYENFVKNTRSLAETNLAAAANAMQPMLAATTGAVSKSGKKAA
ncbi:MAG TPA: phasin family protein [Aromatoleum sp.]|uniref:phasin family protein n=1 Tax=Aromatoleum sp. TaxID=2307007 RepID=UPI002B47A153|nr:phasin family protein [Aromatoleum sp.]HJV28626.1 phasin family protein [Aromatoleum sp.]